MTAPTYDDGIIYRRTPAPAGAGWFERLMCRVFPRFDIVIEGDLYIRRWQLLHMPRLHRQLWLHRIVRPDDVQALHDHPFDCTILMLKGGYRETYHPNPAKNLTRFTRAFKAPCVRSFHAEHAHALTDLQGDTWTLLWAKRFRREWGFWVFSDGHGNHAWMEWIEYLVDISGRNVK